MNNYKVAILTAGRGSRLGEKTKYLNKALLRVGDKAVISHTIDQFPIDTEFVIALGYKGYLVRQYLEITYPERQFVFVDVDRYTGPGTGPGYSLMCCRDHLQCPFYYVSCDAIISWKTHSGGTEQDFARVKFDWAGWDYVDDPKQYCTIEEKAGFVDKIYNKKTFGTDKAFVGVAFINNYKLFWQLMDEQEIAEENEIQTASAILGVKPMLAVQVGWHDVGNEEGLAKAREYIKGFQNLDKVDEEIYFVNGHVVKFFSNEEMVEGRLARAATLNSSVPKIENFGRNFYSYKFVGGQDLFQYPHPEEIMKDFLLYVKKSLWEEKIELNIEEKDEFRQVCRDFYYNKTRSRIEKLLDKTDVEDGSCVINGINIRSLNSVLRFVEWEQLRKGLPSRFHGDMALGNIVYGSGTFKFLDWRQDFGGIIEYGDRYYDLAKIYCSFFFPLMSVKAGKYYLRENNRDIKVYIEIPVEMEKCKDIFEDFVREEGYDLWKIQDLVGIILLNMSPLHEPPLDKFLYYYGLWLLQKSLMETF